MTWTLSVHATPMILPLILTLSGMAFEPPAALATPLATTTRADAVGELLAEFEAAKDAWRQRLRDAEGIKEKKAIRAEHPVKAFWPRFEALANGKDRAQAFSALLWMLDSVRDRGLRLSELDPERKALAERVAAHHAEAWFLPGISALAGERKTVGEEWLLGILRKTAEVNESTEVQAAAMFEAVGLLRRIGGEESEAEAKQLLARLVADYGETPWGMRARGELVSPEDLLPGKVAPDFIGETIDGHQFKLSDYRGKVVVLDFYGFW